MGIYTVMAYPVVAFVLYSVSQMFVFANTIWSLSQYNVGDDNEFVQNTYWHARRRRVLSTCAVK